MLETAREAVTFRLFVIVPCKSLWKVNLYLASTASWQVEEVVVGTMVEKAGDSAA